MKVAGRPLQAQIVAAGQWTARRDAIRPAKPDTKPRRCLRCGKMFDSQGPGNRICCRGGAEGAEVFGQLVYW